MTHASLGQALVKQHFFVNAAGATNFNGFNQSGNSGCAVAIIILEGVFPKKYAYC
jgi:hypothetical protein